MSEHVWSQENIAAYVAGGLDATERERLEQHLAGCSECAREVESARALERRLEPLFRAARPGPALEDRLIRALPDRAAKSHRSLRLMFRSLSGRAKLALAAAAALLLMALGAGINEALEDGPDASVGVRFDDPKSTSVSGAYMATPNNSTIALGTGSMAEGYAIEGKKPIVKSAEEMASELNEKNKEITSSRSPSYPELKIAEANLARSEIFDAKSENGKSGKALNLQQPPAKTEEFAIDPKKSEPRESPAEKKLLADALDDQTNAIEKVEKAIRDQKHVQGLSESPPQAMKPMDQKNGPSFGGLNAFGYSSSSGSSSLGSGGGQVGSSAGTGSGGAAVQQLGRESNGKKKEIAWNYQNNSLPTEPRAYFMLGGKSKSVDKAPIGGPGSDLPALLKPVPYPGLPPAATAPPVSITNGNMPIPPDVSANLATQAKEPKEVPAPAEPKAPGATQSTPKVDPPAQQVRKVILRSGELEFEIESFDAAVAAIMKLVNATKGGFIATINSEKLPNGKVRGSVVVRVPPEQLDGLVLDLRRDLGKQGELKNQRIGSQDVTKQYTDLESKLRASRTMEDRLLNIIKEGKGQIKDLLLAEKELGVWRTQIEEIEGELRYYSNLATLSTLTLKLHEKNIRSAASITENERIQAGLEVEEVEKAFKDALKIVDEAKGRITRSELKQQSAGQFNAVLHFEVAPDAAGPVRDLLRQLGTMVRLQIDRVQQPGDGGAPPPKDGKIERGNTQFQVSIYNLANIAPRETVILRIAASDVPAAYRKLRDVIAKAKGHVVNAQLNEEDKQKINAQLDFNVRRVAEGEILAALAATGETMTRQVNRVPDADGFTDSKVLFRLSLVDADFIQPRETVTMRIAADDVKAAYNKLRAVLAQAKTRVINADLNEKDKRNISAQFDFTFARTEEGVLRTALALLGETLSHQVTRLADTNNVTDTKVLARIEVVQLDNIQPRETLFVNIAAADVRQSYLKLQEELAKLKANIINADINEKDRQNVRAALDFTIRRTDEPAVQTILSAAGESLSRQSARLADNGNLTDTKVLIRVELFQTDSLPPRETVSLKIAAVDVPAAYQSLRTAVAQAKGRETKAELNENDRRNATGLLIFDVPRAAEPALQTLLANLGETLSRQVLRKEETIGVTNAKVGFQIDLKPAALISPRETVTLALEVSNAKAVSDLLTLFNADVTEAKGQVVQTQIGQQRNGQVSAHIVYDVPLTALATLADKFRTFGQVRVHQVERDPQAPEGKLALGRIVVTISNADLLFPTDHGLGSEIRRGFTRSLTGLLRSVSWLFISVFFILPWALLAYAIVWVVRRMMGYGRGAKTVATSPPTPAA